jgi:hypothetical protein
MPRIAEDLGGGVGKLSRVTAFDGYEEPVDISFNRIARCCLVRYAYPDVAKGKAHKK